jgi:hypothetical protein
LDIHRIAMKFVPRLLTNDRKQQRIKHVSWAKREG